MRKGSPYSLIISTETFMTSTGMSND